MDKMEKMLQSQILDRGVRAPGVIEAMRKLPREVFVPAELREDAYTDQPLPIGHGQTISQPFIVALMTEALDVAPSHRILEVGTGCGYQTAILALMAEHVYSIERLPALASMARAHLGSLGITNVDIREGDGTLGWPDEAPFDRILLSAAGPQSPRNLLLSQLADGGIAVLPCGGPYDQILLKVTRSGDTLTERFLCGCRFVKLIGEEGWPEGQCGE